VQDKEGLIQELVEDKDYGTLTRDELSARIREGSVEISAGLYSPVLREATSGRLMRGSGAMMRSGVSPADYMAALGDELMEGVVRSLVTNAQEGDSRAAMFLIKLWMGDSTPTTDVPPLMEQMHATSGTHRRVHN